MTARERLSCLFFPAISSPDLEWSFFMLVLNIISGTAKWYYVFICNILVPQFNIVFFFSFMLQLIS